MGKMKKFRKHAIPKHTSFGGSLNFGSEANFPEEPKVESPKTTGNVIWNVDFINKSTIIRNPEFLAGINALQKQVNEHFLPAWSIGAKLNIVSRPRGNAIIYVMDVSTDVGILGYHDVTYTQVPVGFVFAKTAKNFGESWQFTASHELLELLADPYVNLAAEGTFVGSTAFFAYEVADPIEGDGGYKIDNIQVSNFVLPSWFVDGTADKYDYLNTLDAPFTISSGGTLSYFRAIGNWQDVTSNQLLPKVYPKFSRGFKRRKRTDPNYGKGRHEIIPHPHTRD